MVNNSGWELPIELLLSPALPDWCEFITCIMATGFRFYDLVLSRPRQREKTAALEAVDH